MENMKFPGICFQFLFFISINILNADCFRRIELASKLPRSVGKYFVVAESAPFIVDQSFTIPCIFAALGGTSLAANIKIPYKVALASAFMFLSMYVYSKVDTVRFRFDSEAFSLTEKEGTSIG